MYVVDGPRNQFFKVVNGVIIHSYYGYFTDLYSNW